MGRKVKSLESQLEKQQQELNAGQRGVRVCVSAHALAGYSGLSDQSKGHCGRSICDLHAPVGR